MAAAKITKHQRETLMDLAFRSTVIGSGRPGRFIWDRECGGPAALQHLYEKGLVERTFNFGPRGGEKACYRPNEAGWAIVDRERAKRKAERERSENMADVDQALINARRSGDIVCVYVGDTVYFRGVPGEPVRDETTGKLLITIGLRKVPLMKITKVVPG